MGADIYHRAAIEGGMNNSYMEKYTIAIFKTLQLHQGIFIERSEL